MIDTVIVRAADLREDDRVDLESCPYLKEHGSAEWEYATVSAVKVETPTCVCVYYEGIDAVGYHPDQLLRVRKDTHASS